MVSNTLSKDDADYYLQSMASLQQRERSMLRCRNECVGTSEQDLDAETGDMMLALDALWVGDAATEAASPSQA